MIFTSFLVTQCSACSAPAVFDRFIFQSPTWMPTTFLNAQIALASGASRCVKPSGDILYYWGIIYIIIYITFTENGTAVPDTASSSSWDLMGSHHPCGLVHDSGGFYGIFPRENPPEAGFDMFLSFWSLPCLRDLLAKSQFVGNFDPTDWQVDVSQDQ